jgi:hypothetical protein
MCKGTGSNGKRKNIGTGKVIKATKVMANLSTKNKANMNTEGVVSKAAMNKEADIK